MKYKTVNFAPNPALAAQYRVRQGSQLNLKLEVIAAYGGRCRCCGDPNWQFLTVDHVYGDGKTERESGLYSNFYTWLKERGFPKDRYQLLCMNCNVAKHRYGVCPHQVLAAIPPFWGVDRSLWACLCFSCQVQVRREEGRAIERHQEGVHAFYRAHPRPKKRRRKRPKRYPRPSQTLALKHRGLEGDALYAYTEANLSKMRELAQNR